MALELDFFLVMQLIVGLIFRSQSFPCAIMGSWCYTLSGGRLLYKEDGAACTKFWKEPLRGMDVLFSWRGLKYFSPPSCKTFGTAFCWFTKRKKKEWFSRKCMQISDAGESQKRQKRIETNLRLLFTSLRQSYYQLHSWSSLREWESNDLHSQ